MRRPLIAALVVLSIAAAGCASSTPPAWTYAPPTPVPTPGPSGSPGASDEASAAPTSPEASAGAGASESPAGGGDAGAPVVIEALNIAFTTPEVSAPADAPFTIEFRNGDASVPHDVEIKDASGGVAFKGDTVTGVAVGTYNVPALAAGSYPFLCTIHPTTMTGTLKVGG